jgi:mevalonate kinase
MKICAKCPDSEVFQELIDINEGLLVSLGVSHPSLNRVVEVAATHNIHAKVRATIASNHPCPPSTTGRWI